MYIHITLYIYIYIYIYSFSSLINLLISLPLNSLFPTYSIMQANKMLKPDKWHATFDSDGKIFCFRKALKRIILGVR